MVEDATTWPEPLTVSIELESPVNHVVPSVVSDEEDWLRFTMAEKVVEALKRLLPLNVLLLASNVELAAVIVMEPPNETPEPFTVTDEFWSWLFPMVEVATTEPFAFTARRVFARLVMANVVEVALVNVVLAKLLVPEKVLLFARSVELAAVMVMEPPNETLEPFTVTDEFCNWLLPIVEDATTCPEPLTVRIVLVRPLNHVVPSVVSVELEFANCCKPVHVLLFASNVDEAAVMTMLVLPLNETPLIVRGVCSVVAVPAFPETDPFIVCENELEPENELLSERSEEEAAVIVAEPPSPMLLPFTVTLEFWS